MIRGLTIGLLSAAMCAALLGIVRPSAAEGGKTLTADQVRDLQAKYLAERTALAKDGLIRKFSADAVARADQLAQKGAAALAAQRLLEASQAFREARWTLPAAPLDFPEHITRVFGNLRLRHGDYIHALAYSPDGGRLATASTDGSVKIWDVSNGRELRNYRGHPEAVRAVVFAPDGKTVASAAANDIKIWDPETGKEVRTIAAHAAARSTSRAWPIVPTASCLLRAATTRR